MSLKFRTPCNNLFIVSGKIVCILGPTSSGKSELSLTLSEIHPFEIVNYDSLQVYRYFDIGTAKPPSTVRERIPHHMIDIKDPEEEFNAALFVEEAQSVVEGIWERGKIPLFVGGTGLYLRAFLYGLFKAQKDTALRRELEAEFASSPSSLYARLKRIDPEYASKIGSNDKVRMIRALEIFYLTGMKMTEIEKIHGFKESKFQALKIGLARPREDLYKRIGERVEQMFRMGWVDEVREILRRGIKESAKPLSAIGYREILSHLKGVIDLTETKEAIKRLTRNYAKRQITWFSKERGVEWFQYPEQAALIRGRIEAFLCDGS